MKYFLSMLAILALVGGGCVGPVETDSDDAATDTEVGIELEDSDDSEDSDDDEVTLVQEAPVITLEQEQAMDATTDAPVEEPTTEGTTIDLGGGELTYVEETTEPEEAATEDDVQIVDVVLGGAADVNLDMVSGNFFFEPNTITAAPGESIKITFTENSGFHTFVIDELGLSFSIDEGEALKFTAPTEPGSYSYYCDIGSHRAFGMEGTLIVE